VERAVPGWRDRPRGNLVIEIKDDGSGAFVRQGIRVEGTEPLDEIGLAVNVQRILPSRCSSLIDSDGRPAPRTLREVAGLTPLECLLDLSDPGRPRCRLQNEPAQEQKLLPKGIRVSGEDLRHGGILEHCPSMRLRSRVVSMDRSL
jgi:hypothetical protein